MKKKKGVSDVVVTVFFIFLTVLAVFLVSAWVISMTKKNLERGGTCFELRDYIKIIDLGQTCYNSTSTVLTIERESKNYTIDGYVVSISSSGKSNRFDLYDSEKTGDVKMFDGNEIIEIPEPGNARTYIFSLGNGSIVSLGIINKEEICQTDNYNIRPC